MSSQDHPPTQPLHDDLVFHLCDGPLGLQIHHPLLIEIAYHPARNGEINRRYEFKKQRVADVLRSGNPASALLLYERPYRLEAFLDIRPRIDDRQYWKSLAWLWTDTEFPSRQYDRWYELFSAARPERESLMTPDEARCLTGLPDELTVYRGTSRNAPVGLSWTLVEDTAVWFAHRFRRAEPVLVRGVCAKSSVLAYFEARGEQEIVVPDSKVLDRIETALTSE